MVRDERACTHTCGLRCSGTVGLTRRTRACCAFNCDAATASPADSSNAAGCCGDHLCSSSGVAVCAYASATQCHVRFHVNP
jgi:hypothetical protein